MVGEERTLLVLGGSGFVGPALVASALVRGWRVTTFTLELDAAGPAQVERLHGDRRAEVGLAQLRDRRWDAVIDTWQGSPQAVARALALLGPRCGHYGYVSSLLAYRWPPPRPLNERAPLRSPEERGSYAARKAGSERALREALGARALIVRAGLLLGPGELPGRLPWWLLRLSEGGEALAPGTPRRRLQMVDARDLAEWMLAAAERGLSGAFNLACPPGHATMGALLGACAELSGGGAELRWVPDEWLLGSGLSPWSQLPLWVPVDGDGAAIFDVDVGAAVGAGARFRPLERTVADTWDWLRRLDPTARAALRGGRQRLSRAEEAQLLARWRRHRAKARRSPARSG